MLLNIIKYFSFYIITSSFVYCEHVPMILWNQKGSAVEPRPVSAFEKSNDKDIKDFFQSLLKKSSTAVVVYVPDNKLSLESLTPDAFENVPNNPSNILKGLIEEKQPLMFPAVKDPMRNIRELDCGIKDIHLGKHSSESLDKSIAAALENSCIVIVHLGNKGLPNGKKSTYKTTKQNVVGVFTSSKAAWHPSDELHRRSRNLMGITGVDADHFINYTGCIIMYADEISIHVGPLSNNVTSVLNFPPTSVEGSCDNNTKFLDLKFSASGDVTSANLKMNFQKMYGSWKMVNVTLTTSSGKKTPADMILKVKDAEVPTTFSFSCSFFKMRAWNTSGDDAVEVVIQRFQIQPYDVDEVFARSFDCTPFFTLPIWMGILVTILFIIILNMGIFALFEIKTMDRFDDPKGKTITVPVGND